MVGKQLALLQQCSGCKSLLRWHHRSKSTAAAEYDTSSQCKLEMNKGSLRLPKALAHAPTDYVYAPRRRALLAHGPHLHAISSC